jgi:hypothetical protein
MVRLLLGSFLVICGLVLTVPQTTLAQNAGVTLRPATVEEQMDPGTKKDFVVTLTNLSDQEQLYYLFPRDITGIDDGGAPQFADLDLDKTGLELSSWIKLVNETVLVPAGGTGLISFSVDIPANAAPGSHFGGVFVSVEPPRLRESGAAIGYEVGNIVSIRVSGDVVEEAQIRQFSTDNYIYGKPDVNFNIRIENSGNTLVRPRGPLEITNMFGKQVDTIVFNQSSAGVFPRDTREYTLNWQGEGRGFGRYEAIVSPVYGDDGFKTISSSVTFWILPMDIIVPALAVLGVLLLSVFVGVKLYVRRKLAYYAAAGSGRTLVRRRGAKGNSPVLLIILVMLTVTALFFITLLILFA